MKYVYKLTSQVAVICVVLISQQLLGAQVSDVPSLKSVTLAANAAESQACPAVIRLNGNIQTASGGTIRYRWRTSEGDTTPYGSVRMAANESREIIHLQRVGKSGQQSASGWVELEVSAGNIVRTARADFRVTCVKDPLRAGTSGGIFGNVLQGMVQGDKGEDNFLDRFRELYLRRRGYSLDNPFDTTHSQRYAQLRDMRRVLQKPHVPIGWLNPGGPGAPGTVDASNCAWSSVGPTNINGRITKIAVDPTNNQRLFVTTVGGIWRSTDGARRWQRVSDDFIATVFASVAINPSTPTEVFAGSGDPNYHAGGWRAGTGIWRSTVNGDPGSWAKVSPPELDNQVVYRLIVDPVAPNNVYAATSVGVYIGTRSGGTITFARLAGFDAWANDIAINFSVTPRLIYAGVRQASGTFARGVWKFDGTTWNQRNTGIPTASSRTIVLAIAQSNPSVLYAKVESNNGQSQGVYKTTTAAETPMGGGNAWAATGSALNDSCCCGGFCYSWYNSVLEVDPANENIVWGGGLGMYRTPDGGASWPNVSGGTDATYPLGVHADQHAVAFDPTNSKIVYVGDDGGIFRTTDTSGATWHWNNVAHNMVITEFYRSTSQQASAGIMAGGSQDNGTEITFGNRTWYQPGGCDGADVATDAANASTLYGNCNGGLYELTNPVPGTVGGGASATWTVPMGVTLKSPLVTDSTTAGAALAAGFTTAGMTSTWRLYKTTDGLNWSDTSPTLPANVNVTAIGIAPSSAFQTYYMGVANGQIWRTTNGGGMWTQASTGLPGGVYVNGITVDDTTPSRAIAATSNGIFLTTDTGANWNSILGTGAGALPTTAITGAVFNPSNANDAFAVTDVGAFRGTITPAMGTTPPTASWIPFDEGLPDGLDINDIWVNRTTGILKIGSMGHGAFQRDIRPGITCPSARLLVRDNVNDSGVVPSVSGIPDPEHPIPDPARPGFYKPDDSGGLWWWQSTDVRIDVPTSAPVKNQIASADHVEMQTCPINVADCPAGTLLDQNPQRGRDARVYAQVTNTGLQPGTNVRITALYADATPGLPLLPNDFWTTTFPAGSTTCGALDTTTGWRFVEPGSPCRVIPVVNPDVPEVVRYNWAVPIGQAEHSCVLIISESASDPLDPNIRATNEVRVWELVPNNRQITLRNLHIVDAPPAPPGGAPMGMDGMNIHNPTQNGFVELVFSRVDLPPDALLGVILPSNAGVTATGARSGAVTFKENELQRLHDLQVQPNAYYRIEDPREAVLRLPVPPQQTWRIAVVYDAAPRRDLETLRWSVLLRQGTTVLGGDTFLIRPRIVLNGPPPPPPPGGLSTHGFFSLGARGGVVFPNGTGSSFYNPGGAATVDLEYHATNQFSLFGLFGFRHFAAVGPFQGLNVYQFSVGPKVYLTTGAMRPFVNAGVGAFVLGGSGTTKVGVNTGGGLQFRIRPRFWLEGEYNYHSVFTSGSNFNFSTVQAGVRFRF